MAISTSMGKPTSAILTRMDEPLGHMIGNSLEVTESIDCLQGKGPVDLMEVTYALGTEMLILGGIQSTQEGAMIALKSAIDSGEALEGFRALIEAQGGDGIVVDNYNCLPRTENTKDIVLNNDSPMLKSMDICLL